jgi:AcrR family transcriptional regulator
MKQSADTKERLLDAAEEVFAREGYRAASLRVITNLAAANLAAVNYHFGSKPALLEAVFARRLRAMNQARVRGLALVIESARAAGRPPRARKLIEAFVEATLDHARSGPGERNFMALVLRSLSDTDHTVQRAFESFMKPTFDALLTAMAKALPALTANELWWRLQFAIGAMIRMHHLALAAESEGKRPPQASVAEIIRLLIDFVHAGLSAPPAAPSRHPASAQGEPS